MLVTRQRVSLVLLKAFSSARSRSRIFVVVVCNLDIIVGKHNCFKVINEKVHSISLVFYELCPTPLRSRTPITVPFPIFLYFVSLDTLAIPN